VTSTPPRRSPFGAGYEHLDRIDPAVIRAYLEPWCGTIERPGISSGC